MTRLDRGGPGGSAPANALSVTRLGPGEFEAAWQANPDHRYDYVLHKPMIVLFASLLGAFWAFWLFTALSGGVDLVLGAVGGAFGGLTLWVATLVLRWRGFARLSGIVCEQDRLVWRAGDRAWAVPWRELDLDGIGLFDAEPARDAFERNLTVGGRKLPLYRQYVRIRSMEPFMADLLIRLKAHGRIRKDT